MVAEAETLWAATLRAADPTINTLAIHRPENRAYRFLKGMLHQVHVPRQGGDSSYEDKLRGSSGGVAAPMPIGGAEDVAGEGTIPTLGLHPLQR